MGIEANGARRGLLVPVGGRLMCAVALAAGLVVSASSPSGADTAPANDNFANAIVIGPGGDTVAGTNVGATKQSGEPAHAGNGGGRSVWWSWSPNVSGNVTIDTCGTSFDTTLGVYTGSALAQLTQVASNDDADFCGETSAQSAVAFSAQAGTNYLIAVDGYSNNPNKVPNGPITVHATSLGAAPGAPTIDAVTAGDGWVSVAFSPPAATGGSPITAYVVTTPSEFVYLPATARRAVFQGLDDGTAVTASVTALNDGGESPSSADSSPVTPTAGSVDVTTGYDDSDNTRLQLNATYYGQNAIDAQRTSVGIVAYLVGLTNPSDYTPAPLPVNTGSNSYTTSYTTDDQSALVTVMRQYALTPSEAQYFSVTLIGYLLGLGGH